MTTRGIIFSAPMVLALLAGRKTQTRRLATSPLRRCQIGDRLWVRESYRLGRQWDDFKAIEADQSTRVWPEADRDNCDAHGKLRPSIFMPRWASRLTLIVDDVRVQRLQEMQEADCIAEGAKLHGYADFGALSALNGPMIADENDPGTYVTPRWWFRHLWDSLHEKTGERWDDNPEIVALTFTVHHGNIDEV